MTEKTTEMNPAGDHSMKRVVLVVAAMAAFLTPFMGSSINIALPSIGREFHMDAVLLGWVATTYLLAAAIFLVPFGKIADITGRKKIFASGIFIYSLFSFLSAVSGSAAALIIFRTLQGIGGAMMFGTGTAILTSVFPVGERGKALGLSVASTYLGLSLGPVLGGILTQNFGWRSIFVVNCVTGLIIIGLIVWKMKREWAEARGDRFDLTGSIILGFTLIAIMLGFTRLPRLSGAGLLFVGVLGVLGFIRWETKTPSPVLNMNLFRKNTVFAFSNLAALINYSATFAVGFLLSLYLQYIKGLSPQQAGLILIAQPAVMAAFSPLAGRLSDRIEPRLIASAGMSLSAAGLLLLCFLGEKTTLGFIIAGLILLGFGFALFSSPNTNAIMSSVERRFYGVGSAMLGTMRLTGQMLSMGVAVLIFSIHIGNVQITPAYFPLFLVSLRTAFILFAALCFGGVFASLARGKLR
ncbi:MAG: MFS transporter [Candidatus Aminicenantales bacterium]